MTRVSPAPMQVFRGHVMLGERPAFTYQYMLQCDWAFAYTVLFSFIFGSCGKGSTGFLTLCFVDYYRSDLVGN